MGSLTGQGTTWEGRTAEELARLLDVPGVLIFDSVDSTMDEAHALAGGGAPAGTLVIANEQRAGRGRVGRRWTSAPGAGVWLTLIERPNDPRALDVLSLRIGLRAARALDRFAGATVGLKWPNDLLLHGGKLGGILVEIRWRDARPEWVAVAIGVNRDPPPGQPGAAALGSGVDRADVLAELVPAMRAAAAARGLLTVPELVDYARRDTAAGRSCVAPRPGRVAGIAEDGALLVVTAGGVVRCREGSLRLEGDPS